MTLNIVRGVQAPAQIWAIADFKAEVKVDGHIKADGRGLVFAGGNTIGTAFGTADMAGITSPEFPGERLIVCRNRALALDSPLEEEGFEPSVPRGTMVSRVSQRAAAAARHQSQAHA